MKQNSRLPHYHTIGVLRYNTNGNLVYGMKTTGIQIMTGVTFFHSHEYSD
ncbi:MAG: hypothetical protein RIA69_20340 [Cyclobacteriaceae bacterium]